MGVVKVLVIIFVCLGVLVAGGVAVVMSPVGAKFRGGGSGMDSGTAVTMQVVERGDLARTVSAPGSIEPRTLVKISSQVSAKVLALPFREGEVVKAGDVVVRLDPQDLVALMDSARAGLKGQEASLGGAEASLINARLQFERMEALYETGDATKADLDSARAGFLQAESNKLVIEQGIEQAKAQIERAQKDLDNTVISSPIDGILTALNVEVGETVIVGTTNNPGSVVMEIADLSRMLLKAAVDEANIAPVEMGQDARVFINAYTDREYTGKVARIGLKRNVGSDGTGTFEVEINLDLDEGETLYSGLSASTDITVEHFYDEIVVPSQAVVDRRVEELPKEIMEGNELVDIEKTFARVVYRVIDGKTVVTPVQVGASDLTNTVITAGLSNGDTVVVGPYRALVTLAHDQAVRDEEAIEAEKKANESKDADAKESGDDSETEAEAAESEESGSDEKAAAEAKKEEETP
ncbi:MAG: efflux RND transporter periplasmic adaptor subunit [Phycisphaerales bacterium]|nr:efflux RND transporter periplasmic adaptor subunit [Phycisphaerales bacterium]